MKYIDDGHYSHGRIACPSVTVACVLDWSGHSGTMSLLVRTLAHSAVACSKAQAPPPADRQTPTSSCTTRKHLLHGRLHAGRRLHGGHVPYGSLWIRTALGCLHSGGACVNARPLGGPCRVLCRRRPLTVPLLLEHRLDISCIRLDLFKNQNWCTLGLSARECAQHAVTSAALLLTGAI